MEPLEQTRRWEWSVVMVTHYRMPVLLSLQHPRMLIKVKVLNLAFTKTANKHTQDVILAKIEW